MSYLANVLLGLAFSVANTRDSGLAIRIKENEKVETEFVSKDSQDGVVWENHYPNVGFYLGKCANPVRWELDVKQYEDETVVNALDHAVTTKYYKTFMQSEALSRIFNIAGPQQDMIVKLLYACLAGIAFVGLLVLAVYGGLPS